MPHTIEAFIAKWAASSAAERANKDAFLLELCDVLDVPRPDPTTGDSEKDRYVFERDAKLAHEGGVVTVGKIDLYKAGCFILEAKQGSGIGAKKVGTAKRETPAWNVAMRDAYGQALGYASSFDAPVPFLVACDIGYCFDLYAAFDGSRAYRSFPDAQSSRIFFKDLTNEKHRDALRRVFLDPHSLDPSKKAAKVTREVATYLANLAKKLEADGHPQELIATFLMRCLFTMFAEDVGLLPNEAFTKAIETFWIPSPRSFPGGVESLWRTMNEGGELFGVVGKILKFNGGLFASPTALPLDDHALRLLLVAAKCNWAEVEPAIFGTLIERALDPKERHRLGAHYTPRAYVERLVRPTIEEPLRADWDVVQAQVRQIVAATEELKAEKARKAKLKEAVEAVRAFHRKLCATRVLDPACGSGNFLYVTLDLFKRLEGEVLAVLESLGEKQTLLHMESIRVTPAQFLGIEVKRWAKEIAELVLWIGYLQWHFRMYGGSLPVPEPVLQDYKNIECRDAVLAYDDVELLRDEKGKPVSRWDGETMKRSPVTGEEIPDENARVPVYTYVNPRKAEWPKADFIVGNPPFVGNKRMRHVLGDGYVETLRRTHGDMPETADYVMYWWNAAAAAVRAKASARFGLITTNSISQSYGRSTLARHLDGDNGGSIIFAIPDHPWVDSTTAAAVRIAMTVFVPGSSSGILVNITRESSSEDGATVELSSRSGKINADLTVGAPVAGTTALASNKTLGFRGITLVGDGFIINDDEMKTSKVVRTLVGARALLGTGKPRRVIDLLGLTEAEARSSHPAEYQRLYETVRPVRLQQKRAAYAANWWTFAEPRSGFRIAASTLQRFIATIETARHRWFTLVDANCLPEQTLVAIALSGADKMAVLSSRVHTTWSAAAGARLGVGNDLRYTIARCFDPFPFPICSEASATRIGELGEQVDIHRKRQQSQHPNLIITGMYNVLEKLRSGEPLNEKDKVIHEQGLVSVLKQIHDDLDAAVFDAYGWPHDLTDEQILERLVALNRERAEEEKRGLVRWLRPDFQNPQHAQPMQQVAMGGSASDDEEINPAVTNAAASWPKRLPDQIAAVRDLVTKSSEEWSAAQVAAAFKGAKAADVEEVLDSLAALGLLVGYELMEGRRWRSARFVG